MICYTNARIYAYAYVYVYVYVYDILNVHH